MSDGTTIDQTINQPFTPEQNLRLAALDRAIDRLHADTESTPDAVVALAAQFEKYLKG